MTNSTGKRRRKADPEAIRERNRKAKRWADANPTAALREALGDRDRLRRWAKAEKPDGSPAPKLRALAAALLPDPVALQHQFGGAPLRIISPPDAPSAEVVGFLPVTGPVALLALPEDDPALIVGGRWGDPGADGEPGAPLLRRGDERPWLPAPDPLRWWVKALASVRGEAGRLSALAEVVEGRPRTLAELHVDAYHPASDARRPMVRIPGPADLALTAPLRTVEVDGEPVASPAPPADLGRFALARRPEPGRLFPGPRTIRRADVGDLILYSLAQFRLTGDERSAGLIRSDTWRLAALCYALSGPAALSEADGVAILTGATTLTEANRRRWWTAVKVLRFLTLRINPRTEEWRDLAAVSIGADGRAHVGPPRWWIEGGWRWRLAGGLFRPALHSVGRGRSDGWGGVERTVSGIEAALSYGPTARRGRDGRTSDYLRPRGNRKTGPGDPVFVSWRDVLRLSGEPIPEGAPYRGALGGRYRRRVAALEEAGYFVPQSGGAAEAGDSVEVVERVRPAHGRPAGLKVRASARFVEAQRLADRNEWTRLPARRLILPP